ncbi:predicted protein [Cyanophage PSS2]|uniref:hypothetical protein n=1 Tax=Cyanophage PSS2 TaxID=658401 RepID=UPI0001B03FFB|nr:hypothetical protein PSS2_gp038 [Cyanophage PSS2]ACT65600.1 hypothetical protein [Cyanophage PSS2]ACY75744.1 predicted protein [Cyanophage PSS2]
MNFLAMIQAKAHKDASLAQAQALHAKAYRGIEYTSAHQSPAKLSNHKRQYRGIEYSV